MITVFFIELFVSPLLQLVNDAFLLVPDLALPLEINSGALTLFGALGYIFPLGQLLPILICSIGLTAVHFTWVVILRIKSFIPTMGN